MWFRIRDTSVSDRLRSRCRPGDRVAQTISVDTIFVDAIFVDTVNPPARGIPCDSPLRENSGVHAESFRFTDFHVRGECELADGWRPYPAGR